MRMILVVLASMVVVAGSTFSVLAEESSESDRLAKIVAPFIDAQTLVIVHVDLMAFDSAKSVDLLARLAQFADRDRDILQAKFVPINVISQSLPKGTTIDVFIVVGLADLARLPFFLVMPLDATTPANAIAVELRREIHNAWRQPLVSQQIGDALVTGSQESINRLKTSQTVARKEIAVAFQTAGQSAMQVAFVPSPELRGLAESILPKLPKQVGGGPTKAFTQGVVWAAVAVDLPPKRLAVRVVLQSINAAAAVSLERELSKLFEEVGLLPQIQEAIPEFAELSKGLLPKASGDQLQLELTEENKGIAALSIIEPALRVLIESIAGR